MSERLPQRLQRLILRRFSARPADQIPTTVISVAVNEAEDSGWQEELATLKTLIDDSKEAYSDGNQTSRTGFINIFARIQKMGGRYSLIPHFSNLDELVQATWENFDRSYNLYSALDDRPSFPEKTGLRRFPNTLTPREIRLLVRLNGLHGSKFPLAQVAKSEGINASTASLAATAAKFNLYWHHFPRG